MRTYEETHPWIKFGFNLASATPHLWLWLGEACSKIEHLSKMPLQPETSARLLQVYLAKGAAATTAIEGNSLSEAEVLEAVKGQLIVQPSKEYQKQEVENVLGAFNKISAQIAAGKLPTLSTELIRDYNREILKNLPLEEGTVPGVFREHSVVVGNFYRGAPAQDCDYLMDRLCSWLDGQDFHAPEGLDVVYAIIKAIVAHIYIAWIHPFGDGNGRTARLIEVHILMSACVPSPAAHLLSNHYNQTRAEYYRQLANASNSGGDILPFIQYAVRGLVDGLRVQLESVWQQNWDVAWENYVHELFPLGSSSTNARRHNLALELGKRDDWVDISILNRLSTNLASAYATKGQKTVQRDINALAGLGLIERLPRRIRARREIIFSFLPVRKQPSTTITQTEPSPSSGQLQLGLQ